MLSICLAMLETEEDQRRFTRLFEAHEKKIYAVALRILGDRTRAEDAAQQTWLQLLRNWKRVSALPWRETEGYRRGLELKCVEEQTNREIARRLRIHESTVAVRVLRGRAMLRDCLEREGYTYEAV